MAQTLEVNKLYTAKPFIVEGTGGAARVELHGTVNIIIYGSEIEQDAIADMTPISETLSDSAFYAFDTLPEYVVFTGSADRITVGNYTLTYVKDIT